MAAADSGRVRAAGELDRDRGARMHPVDAAAGDPQRVEGLRDRLRVIRDLRLEDLQRVRGAVARRVEREDAATAARSASMRGASASEDRGEPDRRTTGGPSPARR